MTHASLFSGIGGFDLAASWTGWKNAFWCEVDPFCRKILKYYFKKSKGYEDIKKTDFSRWRGRVDVLTAGFPCQPFSLAGRREGKERFVIDHKNRNSKDNRISNLRLVTPAQNNENRNKYSGRFSDEDKDLMFLLHLDGHMSFSEISEHFECSKSRVHQIFAEHRFNRLDGITFPSWRRQSIKAFGNAIVPQVAYEIFKTIDTVSATQATKRNFLFNKRS